MLNKALIFIACIYSFSSIAQTDSINGNKHTFFSDGIVRVWKQTIAKQDFTSIDYNNKTVVIDTAFVSDGVEFTDITELILTTKDTLVEKPYIVKNGALLINIFNTGDNRCMLHVRNTQNLKSRAKLSAGSGSFFVIGNYVILFRLDMDETMDGNEFNLIISRFSLINHKYENKIFKKIKHDKAMKLEFSGDYQHDLECAKQIWKYSNKI